MRAEKFNKGYPNSWYYLAKVSDIRPGHKKIFRIAGREILAYRSHSRSPSGCEEDELGVLHPFCPHLGTNLKDGRVSANGRIICPAHGWCFKPDGTCVNVPDSRLRAEEYPKGVHAKKYHHAVFHGMIYVWIHDDWAEPTFTLDSFFDHVEKDKNMKPINSLHRVWVANMHVMEPAQNSADIHHFKYLHHEIPYFNGHFTGGVEAKTDYCYKGDDFAFRMDNVGVNMKFFGRRLPSFAEKILSHSNSVVFFGPTLQLTLTKTYFCNVVSLTNWVPTERFMLEAHYMTFVDNLLCWPIALFLERLVVAILDQDRPIWEARDNSMRLMDNDGFFVAYREWLGRFYSEKNRVPCTDSLEW